MQLTKALPIIAITLMLPVATPAGRAQSPSATAAPDAPPASPPDTTPAQPAATTATADTPPAQPKQKFSFHIGPEASLYLPTSAKAKDRFGNQWPLITFGLGKLNAVPNKGETSFAFQIGYRKKGDNELLMAPVGLEYRLPLSAPSARDGGIIPQVYAGAGAAACITSMRVPSDDIKRGTRVAPEGSVFLGLQWHQTAYVEARYNAIGSIRGIDLSGVDFSAGFRF